MGRPSGSVAYCCGVVARGCVLWPVVVRVSRTRARDQRMADILSLRTQVARGSFCHGTSPPFDEFHNAVDGVDDEGLAVAIGPGDGGGGDVGFGAEAEVQ